MTYIETPLTNTDSKSLRLGWNQVLLETQIMFTSEKKSDWPRSRFLEIKRQTCFSSWTSSGFVFIAIWLDYDDYCSLWFCGWVAVCFSPAAINRLAFERLNERERHQRKNSNERLPSADDGVKCVWRLISLCCEGECLCCLLSEPLQTRWRALLFLSPKQTFYEIRNSILHLHVSI